jgi:hypothetical protein
MKKLLKIAGVLAVLGVLALAYIWFFVYNKPHLDYAKATPELIVSAKECFQSFTGGNTEATGKIIQLTGTPSYVEEQDSLVIVVFVFNEGMFGDEGIRCTMLPQFHQAALNMKLTRPVEIKGLCTGYNGTDVILEHCSFVNQ